MKYIDVAIDNKSEQTDTLYTYGCEDDQVKIGQKVSVPFGKGDRIRDAYVFRMSDEPEREFKKLKYAQGLDDEVFLNEEMIRTCIWMKNRYLCKYIEAVKCFVPAGSKSKRGKQRNPFKDAVGEKTDILKLTNEQEHALQPICMALVSKKHKRFLLHGVTGSGRCV